jgi:hypothetical protein
MQMCTDHPDIPRRIRVDLATPIEREIRELRNKIEGMGAHPLLTDAVVLMGNVLSKMADYVESDKGMNATANRVEILEKENADLKRLASNLHSELLGSVDAMASHLMAQLTRASKGDPKTWGFVAMFEDMIKKSVTETKEGRKICPQCEAFHTTNEPCIHKPK